MKSARGGYDGRSQVKLGVDADGFEGDAGAIEAWKLLGQAACVVEKALDLEKEISVMVARSPGGEVKSFPSAMNHHENQILAWSVIPSSVPMDIEQEAQRIALRLAELLKLEGLLAVEMFLTTAGRAAGE